MQSSGKRFRKQGLAAAVAAASLVVSLQSQALEFDFDNSDLEIDWDTSISYGALWRVQSAEPNTDNLAASWNTNDGTYNFDKGLASSKFTLVSEADFRWRDYGFFLRGKALYDYRYENMDTDQDDFTYLFDNSGTGGDLAGNGYVLLPLVGEMGDLPADDFHRKTRDIHGQDAFFLDAFLYGDFEIGGKFLTARAGRQVISWGESFFFPNISNAQSHLDAAAAGTPGTQTKELFMPIGSVYGNLELNQSISIEAYYQYEWKPVKQAGVGSYWSNSDVSGAGAERFILFSDPFVIPVPVLKEVEPDGGTDDDGWGLALRYFLESGTEFGFYRLRYHAKYPSVQGYADPEATGPFALLPVRVSDLYLPDQDLWGASFSTLVGDVNIVGEISYIPNGLPTQQTVRPLVDDSGSPYIADFVEGHITQANLGLWYLWSKTSIADSISLFAEATYIRSNLDKSDMGAPGQLLNDENAWGYSFALDFMYKSVMPGVDLTVKTAGKHGVDGTWKDIGMQHNAKEFSIGVEAKYLANWKGLVRYSTFWGAKDTFTKHDRDNISLSVTYSF